jgi:hypothetical protein
MLFCLEEMLPTYDYVQILNNSYSYLNLQERRAIRNYIFILLSLLFLLF